MEFTCLTAVLAVAGLEHLGMSFSRDAECRICWRPFGGQTLENERTIVHRVCSTAGRTDHAILHTLY